MGRKVQERRLPKSSGFPHIRGVNHPSVDASNPLRDGGGWFRAWFERSADAMALLDPVSGAFLGSNAASTRAVGAETSEEILGMPAAALAPEFQDDGRPSAEVAAEAMRTTLEKGSHRFEWTMKRLDGVLTQVDVTATALAVEGQTFVLTVTRNIERSKRIEDDLLELNQSLERRIAERTAELRESEERFKALFEHSPVGMSRVDWSGHFLQVNSSFARTIGYTREELEQMSYWDITPAEYADDEQRILETVQTQGTFGPFEKEYIHRDGHRVPIMISGMLIEREGERYELWGITQDMTVLKQAEQALRESEKKFRTLFQESSQGVMLHDENTNFSEVNPAAAALFGMAPEDFTGRHPSELAAEFQPNGETSAAVARREIGRCLATGTARFEWTHLHTLGHAVDLEVVLSRIPNGDGYLMQAVVTDISERKRAEQELMRALERERELNQLKSNFVSMVSHEFRTPLGIIQSSAEILDDYLDQLSPQERREQLRSIIKNSRRMAGLMEDVLLLGRLDSGRMEFLPKPLDLAALCRRLVDEVRSTTDARCPIEFSTGELPVSVFADERLLRHVLLNLLSNAVKYSVRGRPVAFHAEVSSAALRFVVRDRGIGIPEADLPGLFEAFRRGSNVGQTPGTGLGLVIVKQSVELHGGSIDVRSRSGGGTTFTITIPQSPE